MRDSAIDILLGFVRRIKDADRDENETIGRLETEAFEAVLDAFMRKGRIEAADYRIMSMHLADAQERFFPKSY